MMAQCLYSQGTSSLQFHPFMPGIDAARRVLLLIFFPPFLTGGAGFPRQRQFIRYGEHDIIWNAPGQPLLVQEF